ncbi:MAG: tetratricopeptide repeat protein [Bacteroidales bacterium]|nr:tetratricopeptide repeat protein [Bacteroidales bacterium]
MKKILHILVTLLLTFSFLPGASAQKSERIYSRAVNQVQKENYFKAANTFLKAYRKGFYPGFRAFCMASICFDVADYKDYAYTYAMVGEEAASFFYYGKSGHYDNIPAIEEQPILKGQALFDSLFTLTQELREREIMHEDFNPSLLLYAITSSFYSMENYDSCIMYANIALTHLNEPEFAIFKGDAYLDQLNGDSALRAFKTAMKFDPGNTDAITGVGEAYELLEEFDSARKFYELAAAKDTNDLYAQYSLALLHLQENRYTEALKSLQFLVQEHPSYYFPYFDIGGIYFDLELYAKAIYAYEKFLEWEPGNEDALYNLKAAKFNMEQEFHY